MSCCPEPSSMTISCVCSKLQLSCPHPAIKYKFFGTFSLYFPGCAAYFVKSTISSSSCFFFICSILPGDGVKYAPKIDRCCCAGAATLPYEDASSSSLLNFFLNAANSKSRTNASARSSGSTASTATCSPFIGLPKPSREDPPINNAEISEYIEKSTTKILESGFARAASHASWYAMNVLPAPPLLFAKHIPARYYYRPPEKKTEEEEKERVNTKVPTIFKLFNLFNQTKSKSSKADDDDKNDDDKNDIHQNEERQKRTTTTTKRTVRRRHRF